ncbi:MAG: Holliday junction branch migration protein RuvA [Gemmataceae bacterium]
MITKLTGRLVRVLDEEIRVEVGPFEYQVLVPEMVRRQVQLLTGQEITLHISEYLEGGPNANKFIPRKIGFLHEAELEFFDLFCTVDKIGAKKALKALAQPVQDIANAVSREDAKWLTSLPGIGAATAEQIVTTLKRKVTKFALTTGPRNAERTGKGVLFDEIYQSLMKLGLTPLEARSKLDALIASGKPFATVEDGISLIFMRG